MDLQRLQALSGRHPKQALLEKLQKERDAIIQSYDEAIAAAQRNEPLEEGLFSSLKIALGTAANMGKSAGSSVAAKVKMLASSVKEMYKDAKAQAELTQLIKEMNGILVDFDDACEAAPTILSKDAKLKEAMDIQGKLMKRFSEELAARQAAMKGLSEAVDIEKMIDEQKPAEEQKPTEEQKPE